MKQQVAETSPFKVGLTGGIASGKTTVANLFAAHGVPVIDTDIIARDVVEPGKPALNEIHAHFGDSVINESGMLDRTAMRKLIFCDSHARERLEAILHPRIGDEVRRRSQTTKGDYQIIAVPLLVGSPLLQFVDRVLVVDCREETQIERLIKRDAGTRDDARRILAAQSSREQRLAIADDVINNDQDLSQLEEQVNQLHSKYQALAGP